MDSHTLCGRGMGWSLSENRRGECIVETSRRRRSMQRLSNHPPPSILLDNCSVAEFHGRGIVLGRMSPSRREDRGLISIVVYAVSFAARNHARLVLDDQTVHLRDEDEDDQIQRNSEISGSPSSYERKNNSF